MNFLDSLAISSSGLSAQRLRMNLISSNMANVNTTRMENGEPYKRKDVIFEAAQVVLPIDEPYPGGGDDRCGAVVSDPCSFVGDIRDDVDRV